MCGMGRTGKTWGTSASCEGARTEFNLAGTLGSGKESLRPTSRRLAKALEEGASFSLHRSTSALTLFATSYAAISAVLVSKKVVDVMAAGSGPPSLPCLPPLLPHH